LRFVTATTMKSLFLPGALWLAAAAALVYFGWLPLALPALTFLYCCTAIGGMLLAWRFHSSRTLLALAVLLLAQQATTLSAAQAPYIPSTLHALAVLLPMNFVLIALMHESGFSVQSLAWPGLFLFVQALTVTVLCGAATRVQKLPVPIPVPVYAEVVMVVTFVFLAGRFLLKRNPIDSALLWSLAAFLLALRNAPAVRVSTAFWATAACILATAVIEKSYLLAYHDELTSLPSRRAFNDALLRLQAPYSIAVVDIDHFKRFNDTYGHDTGDQVLRLVASNLARVTGGGEAFRCGGEEFNILFPGKSTAEALPHLETLRHTIQNSEFRLRGSDRRQVPRGPDRRDSGKRRKAKKQQGPTESFHAPSSSLSVTVSIGVATSTSQKSLPESVLESADKALYRAKANGRNRVETASFLARRVRSRAARMA